MEASLLRQVEAVGAVLVMLRMEAMRLLQLAEQAGMLAAEPGVVEPPLRALVL